MKKPRLKYILGITAKLLALFVLAVLIFIATVQLGAWGALPTKEDLRDLSQQNASEIYDRNGALLGKFYLQDRQPISLDSIPQHVIDALIATEDARFYEHNGIDTRSLFRVLFKTILLQDSQSGGGSTLTQQLAKNLFSRKNYGPFTVPVVKTKEMITARRLERIYTKTELLELYLNTVPFSGNTYGIESASLKFFNKSASGLTLTEAATLVGTLKATATYNPYRNPERSKNRRNVVLAQMQRYGYLESEVYTLAREDSVKLDYGRYHEEEGLAPYFRETLRLKMLSWCEQQKELGKECNLYTSGLKIYTTLDKTLQEYAEDAVEAHLDKLQNEFEAEYGSQPPWGLAHPIFKSVVRKSAPYIKLKTAGLSENEIMDSLSKKREQQLSRFGQYTTEKASTLDSLQHYLKFLGAGMLAIDPSSGAVRTWVGGVDFRHFKFDHVAKNKRQVGSTFKPLVYATALERGIRPCDYFSAREIQYENMQGWSPSNAGDLEEDYMNYSMETALSQSINTVSVKVLEKAGIANTIDLARRLGIDSDLPQVPSLALGTAEITIPEIAGAYAAFVNDGKAVTPYYLMRIEDSEGKIMQSFQPKVSDEPAFSKSTRQIMLEMLKSVVDEGTAKRMRTTYSLPNALAGKTGTTQSNKDAWFVAIMPKMVTVTWVGHDDHRIGFKSTRIGQGAHAALPITARWLQKINRDRNYSDVSQAKFSPPNVRTLSLLDCEPTKRDSFFKRLFTNPKKKKKREFKDRN